MRWLTRKSRVAALQTFGHAKGALHGLRGPAGEPLEDADLAHKVESVLFRDRQVPKGRISINAEGGKVFLRGQIESDELIRRIVRAAGEIPDVGEVVNLLHLPGTEAPRSPAGRLLVTRRSGGFGLGPKRPRPRSGSVER
jgi:hypothetical protein